MKQVFYEMMEDIKELRKTVFISSHDLIEVQKNVAVRVLSEKGHL